MGAIRQELLSGIRSDDQFKKLRTRLRAFDDIALECDDYEEAARCYNRCRTAGVQGGSVDFLICAVAVRRKLAVFTTDADFGQYAAVVAMKLHEVRPNLR